MNNEIEVSNEIFEKVEERKCSLIFLPMEDRYIVDKREPFSLTNGSESIELVAISYDLMKFTEDKEILIVNRRDCTSLENFIHQRHNVYGLLDPEEVERIMRGFGIERGDHFFQLFFTKYKGDKQSEY